MLQCIETNWQLSKPGPQRSPPKQNWRWQKQPYVDPATSSNEKSLEKAIVRVTGDDWVNQIPTASGLYDANHDKLRNVDLAHRIKAGEFELIELKVRSDNPLFATMECLKYAALFLFARLHYHPDFQTTSELLSSSITHWRVLAPASYFSGWNLGWLEQEIGEGLCAFSRSRLAGLVVDFAFTQFRCGFNWPGDESLILPALKEITNVDWQS